MKLYMVPLAPNPTKVMLYIAEREAAGEAFGIEPGRHRRAQVVKQDLARPDGLSFTARAAA